MGKEKRIHTRSEHKEQERAAARNAVIEARLRHRVAFCTCQKEVAPNRVRLWITEPPRRSEAAEYLSLAVNDIATRSKGMRCSRAWCGTPPILGVVNMVGTRNFTCYMGALVEGILNLCGCMGQCTGGGKVCFEG